MQRVNEKNNAKPSNQLKAHAANNPQRAEKQQQQQIVKFILNLFPYVLFFIDRNTKLNSSSNINYNPAA